MEDMMAEVTDQMFFNYSQMQKLEEYIAAEINGEPIQGKDLGVGDCAIRLLTYYRDVLGTIGRNLENIWIEDQQQVTRIQELIADILQGKLKNETWSLHSRIRGRKYNSRIRCSYSYRC